MDYRFRLPIIVLNILTWFCYPVDTWFFLASHFTSAFNSDQILFSLSPLLTHVAPSLHPELPHFGPGSLPNLSFRSCKAFLLYLHHIISLKNHAVLFGNYFSSNLDPITEHRVWLGTATFNAKCRQDRNKKLPLKGFWGSWKRPNRKVTWEVWPGMEDEKSSDLGEKQTC